MIYRVGLGKDHTKIKELVDATGYYNPIFPRHMGGRWVVAEHDGEIRACAWCMIERPNAYIDYWVGTGRTAFRLMAELEIAFRKAGVTMVRAMIHESNTNAIRLAVDGLGVYGQTGYVLIAKELQNGTAENDNDNDSTGSGRSGEQHSEPAGTADKEPARSDG
jgi:hypothetical protein